MYSQYVGSGLWPRSFLGYDHTLTPKFTPIAPVLALEAFTVYNIKETGKPCVANSEIVCQGFNITAYSKFCSS